MTKSLKIINNCTTFDRSAEEGHCKSENTSPLILGCITFDNDMVLPGTTSSFGDIIWDFNHEDNHQGYLSSSLKMHWWSFFPEPPTDIQKQTFHDPRIVAWPTPIQLLEDLKRYMYLYWRFGQIIGIEIHANQGRKYSKGTGGIDPKSAITITKGALRFLAYVINQEQKRHIEFKQLSDLTIDHFRKYIPSCPNEFNAFLKKFFIGLASPIVSRNLQHKVQYNLADAKHIDWNNLIIQNKQQRKLNKKTRGSRKKNGSDDYDAWVPLHPELYCWSSEACRAVIHDFMDKLSLDRIDKAPSTLKNSLQTSRNQVLISSCTADITFALDVMRDFNTRTSKGELTKSAAQYHIDKSIDIHTIKDQIKNGITTEEHLRLLTKIEKGYCTTSLGLTKQINNAIWNTRRAAMWLILQYTGMRWSDACTLKKLKNSSVIGELNGFPVIWGSVVKNVPRDMLSNNDFWFATPIVQDAVRVLEYTQWQIRTDYLFGSWSGGSATGKAMHGGSFSRSIGVMFGQIDVDELYFRLFKEIRNDGKMATRYECILDGIDLHPHRLRESLVAELARLEVGLPAISMQLKHAHNAYRQFNHVTFGYGGQRQTQMAIVQGTVNPSIYYEVTQKIPSAKQEIYNAYFDPNRNYAGGAAEDHTKRLKEFFGGKAWNDEQIKKYIKQLAESGAPLTVCGFGYCNDRQTEGLESEVCSGDLCPPECKNHLITETNARQIEHRYIKCIQYLSSDPFPLHEAKWRSDAARYEAYLKKLGVDVEAIKKTAILAEPVKIN